MTRSRLVLILLLIAAPAAALEIDLNKIFGMAKNLKDAVFDVDEKNEIVLGQGVAANLLGAAPLVGDARMQKYVNALGRWLSLHTERPELPWQFGVLDSPNVNAFATPGGIIFITRGLLQHMRSEAELAGVLAHEIAHVLKRHHLKAIQKNARVSLAGDLVGEAAKKKGKENLTKAVGFGTEMYARGLDKDDELEADRMGIVIAARAGYDPYGLPAVLQTLQALNAEDSTLALMFKTHPAPADRLEALEKLLSAQWDRYGGLELKERFHQTLMAQ